MQPDIEVRESRIGSGVFALRDMEPGECLGIVEGELVESVDGVSQYCVEHSDTHVLEIAPPFRYLNHSCYPNCQLDEGEEGLVVVVLLPVSRGEELTIDYGWGAADAIPCLCESENCRGWVVCEAERDQITSEPKFCVHCGEGICWERLEFLIEARKELTCVNCSHEVPKLILLEGQESGYVEIVPEEPKPTRKGKGNRCRHGADSELVD